MTTLNQTQFAVLGQLYHTPVKGDFEYLSNALITINAQGNIHSVTTADDANFDSQIQRLEQADKLTRLTNSQYLMPGMVDLHIHAPQWPQAGKGLDLPLYDWLQDYTFPLEARFADNNFATPMYHSAVETLLANGTTSAVYFATIHNQASLTLARTCLALGQRSFVGKINMDDKELCPDYYVEDTAQGLADSEQFIQDVLALPGNEQRLVSPVITPRFVPSCTSQMLRGLGELAVKYQCHVQTHCSECDWTRDYSQQHYGKSDVVIYREMGLLTRKTILAHSIFLSDEDCRAIKETGASIAHCPLSNMYFANAAMKTREILDLDLHAGLGTDISGAPIPSVFHTCLDAVNHSRVREDGTNTHLAADSRGEIGSRISFLEAYWMATVGGGLAIDTKVGLFAPEYAFDALIIDTQAPDSDLFVIPELDTPRDRLEKIIALNRRTNVRKVYVQGKQVINKDA
ncbi:MAG: guanine deaminase [Shewanella sp.]|nr:guanine deaminase [Shewanella sp.]MCF1429450.1 guanine deaminase [Shewanella sp.]MCF1437443.1 guanine deaminase [Shewanella sp.]MCF1456641.1 guanine deaminase [Shewanella sp.]